MKTKLFSIHAKYLLQAFFMGLLFFFLNVTISIVNMKYFAISIGKQVKFSSIIEEFIMAVLIGPAIETLLFQGLIIYQTYESCKGKNVKLLAISISAVLFGLSHFYSIYYVIFGVLSGSLLAYTFCYFREKTNYPSAILYVTIIHLISNLLVFILKLANL